jgi:hypothetical protein
MKIHHGGTETRRKSKARRRSAQITADLNHFAAKKVALISVHPRLSAANIFCFSPCLCVSVVELT